VRAMCFESDLNFIALLRRCTIGCISGRDIRLVTISFARYIRRKWVRSRNVSTSKAYMVVVLNAEIILIIASLYTMLRAVICYLFLARLY
jgi:hypothetical protein